jgi:hypothetical protein
MSRAYPIDFVKSFPGIRDSDIEFGLRHGLIEEGSPARLAHLFPVERITSENWTDSHQIWRGIALHWAITHCHDDSRNLFDEIDAIYANFDYPEDMQSIVSFMPGDELSNASSLRQKIFDFYQTQLNAVNKILRGPEGSG